MSQPSDEAVMAAVKEGHLELLGVLFERYHGKAFGLCYGMVHDRAAADDLVQEAFLRVLRYRETFRPSAAFGSWLYRIVRNVCLDQIQSRKKEVTALQGLVDPDTTEPEHWAEHDSEAVERLRSALDQLPEDQREVLVNKRIDGLSYAQIAERRGTSEGAERVRAHRALKELRTILRRIEGLDQ